jgi:hypothetical protein
MNAHKDTQHPAGQIRPTDEELKGQQTLSDYIRSIKRAEAFDTVARELTEAAQEKKLTFEEWWGTMEYPNPPTHYSWAQQIWYTALTRGKVS